MYFPSEVTSQLRLCLRSFFNCFYRGLKTSMQMSARNCLIPLHVFIFSSAFCQQADLKFKHLSSRDGLSQDHVNAIFKDHKGFMWFATDEGLNRYDGYNFSSYKHDPENINTISNSFVYDIAEDSQHNLWIATASGLDKLDRKKDRFIHYKPKGKSLFVKDIFLDGNKRMWIGTTQGLYFFDPTEGTFTGRPNTGTGHEINNDFIYNIVESDGELWIVTKYGVNRFNPENAKYITYVHQPGSRNSIGSNWTKRVFRDLHGDIWVGTQGGGISRFNREDNSFTTFTHDPAD